MAVFRCNHMSESLHRHMDLNIVLPEDLPAEDIPTLYLLHGLSDNQDGWLINTMINIHAREHGIAVVMPDACTSFYTDTATCENYFTYVSQEVVEYTRKVFKLSHKREKTYVAGNSMGGYGAMKCALTHPELFGGGITFSGALDIVSLVNGGEWMREVSTRNWGPDYKNVVENSDADLFALAKKILDDSTSPRPRIMQICGIQDFLYEQNMTFKNFMEKTEFDYRYAEGEGSHTWHFWNKWLPTAIQFMLETAKN